VTASFLALMEGKHDLSVTLIRKAVAVAPGSADVVIFACFMLAFAGHPAEAVPHGERAMQLSPNYPPYYLGILGNAYRLAGRADKAIRCFEDSHARAPGFGLVDLVLIHQQASRTDEAKRRAADLLAVRRDFTIAGWARTQFRADAQGLEADLEALRAAGLPQG
jgi:tetratricopeptide (TPR) repeat protein